MIEKTAAKKQIARLSGLSFFPTTAEAIAELVCSIEAADTEALAQAIITGFLDDFTECPKPAQIRKVVYERNEADEIARRTRTSTCELCGSSGWIITERDGISGADRCRCRSAS